ncbi:MAG: hypothetical protein KAG97_13070, partial [Victivallales bacterium]|nr:hypothetical protein [Victivallales bacterium]
MKCSKCKENDAAYFITHASASKDRIGFCDTCAEEIGIFSALRRVESLMHGYGLKPDGGTSIAKADFPIEFAEACKSCGTELKEFERGFHFGCEECGVVFGSLVNNYLTLLGGMTGSAECAYPGKPPRGFLMDSRIRSADKNLQDKISREKYKQADKCRSKLSKLEEASNKRKSQRSEILKRGAARISEASVSARNKIITGASPFGDTLAGWLLSRIDIRRNFRDYNFPAKCDSQSMAQVKKYIYGHLTGNFLRSRKTISIDKCAIDEIKALEACLFGTRLRPRACVLADVEMSSVALINNLDHLTLLAMSRERDPAIAVGEAKAQLASIERNADVAFSPRFGYLTSAPKYLGTGTSASVYLHLPYTLFRGRSYSLPGLAAGKSITCVPLVGNGFEQHGFYKISSTVGFCTSEEDIATEVFDFAATLVRYEEKIRSEIQPSERKRIANM